MYNEFILYEGSVIMRVFSNTPIFPEEEVADECELMKDGRVQEPCYTPNANKYFLVFRETPDFE